MADRAEVATDAIIRIVTDALRGRLTGGSKAALADARASIVELLRGEFDDLTRMVRDDIRLRDD